MALGPIESRVSVVVPQSGQSAAPARGASSAAMAEHVAATTSAPVDNATQADQTRAQSEAVKSAVEKANKVVQASARDIEFSVDNSTNEVVVKVVDQATKQVIRQIPSEEMLQIAQALDHLQGLLVKQKV